MKNLFRVGVGFTILFVLGCLIIDEEYQKCNKMSKEPSVYSCGSRGAGRCEGPSEQNKCIYSLAIARQDIYLCNQIELPDLIKEGDYRESCGIDVIVSKGSVELCEQLPNLMVKDCDYYYAEAENASVCDKIRSVRIADCYYLYAVKTKNASICDKFLGEQKEFCVANVMN